MFQAGPFRPLLQHQAAALHTESLEQQDKESSSVDKASLAEAWLVMEFCNRGTMRVCAKSPGPTFQGCAVIQRALCELLRSLWACGRCSVQVHLQSGSQSLSGLHARTSLASLSEATPVETNRCCACWHVMVFVPSLLHPTTIDHVCFM